MGSSAKAGESLGSVYVVGDSAYNYYSFSKSVSNQYVDIVNGLSETLKDKATVYDMIIPTSIDITLDDATRNSINSSNQKKAILYMYSKMNKNIGKCYIYDLMRSHRDEYIYFRTDHHWTALGAYYAYTAFMAQLGKNAYSLDSFKERDMGEGDEDGLDEGDEEGLDEEDEEVEGKPLEDYCSRLSIAIFDGEEKVKTLNLKAEDGYEDIGFNLDAGKYRMVAIGHNGSGNCTISSPEKVKFYKNKMTDTFFYYGTFNVIDGEDTDDYILLNRAVAQFKVHITDEVYEIFCKGLGVDSSIFITDVGALGDEAILQVTPFCTVEQEALLMPTLENCTSGRWHPAFTDITARGADKGKGLHAMADYLGLNIEETMAFGDGGNDISIIKEAGVGVAMGNAGEELKQVADYITTHVDEDGVKNALIKYGVI